jgi:hypothetical protein
MLNHIVIIGKLQSRKQFQTPAPKTASKPRLPFTKQRNRYSKTPPQDQPALHTHRMCPSCHDIDTNIRNSLSFAKSKVRLTTKKFHTSEACQGSTPVSSYRAMEPQTDHSMESLIKTKAKFNNPKSNKNLISQNNRNPYTKSSHNTRKSNQTHYTKSRTHKTRTNLEQNRTPWSPPFSPFPVKHRSPPKAHK